MDRVHQIMTQCRASAMNSPLSGSNDHELVANMQYFEEMFAASQACQTEEPGLKEMNDLMACAMELNQELNGELSEEDFMRNFQFTENNYESRRDSEKAYSLSHILKSTILKSAVRKNPSNFPKNCITPDNHWSLVSKNHADNRVPCSGHQLYFYNTQSRKKGKYVINVLQSVARGDGGHMATLAPVLERKIYIDQYDAFQQVIVKDRKLYLIFAEHKDNKGDLIRVNGYDLVDVAPADSLGYIRVDAVNCKWWDFALSGQYANAMSSTDPEMLTFLSHYAAKTQLPKMITFLSLVHFGTTSANVMDVCGPLRVLSSSFPKMEQLNCCKRVILQYKPGLCVDTDLLTTELSQKTEMPFTIVFAIDTVKRPHIREISFSKIDHMTFVKKLLPDQHKQLLSDSEIAKMSSTELIDIQKKIAMDLQFLGIVHKHFLFYYREEVIAVSHFLRHGLSRSCNNVVFPFRACSMPGQVFVCYVSNTYLYIKSSDSKQKTHVTRFNLVPVLKNYRKCANCQKVEEKKRRNAYGKRIALFKVCRLCKTRNYHFNWKEYPCYYCSIECMKAHWETHKEIHKEIEIVLD